MAAFKVHLVRSRALVTDGATRRHINGVAGHHMALLLHLHQLVDAVGNAPDSPKSYAEIQQALSDLAGLHGVHRDTIHGARIALFEQSGGYNVGVVAVSGEAELDARRIAQRQGTGDAAQQSAATVRMAADDAAAQDQGEAANVQRDRIKVPARSDRTGGVG